MSPETRSPTLLAALALAACALAVQPALAEGEKRSAAKPVKTAAKKAPPAETPLPAADEAQTEAAARAHQGAYACEFNQTLSVLPNAKNPGYLDVSFKKDTFTMKPVLSATGALRLEDVKGRGLMIQIANKSMLMDTKVGQRMVDECQHEEQRVAAAAIKAAGNAGPGLGIDPDK